MVRFRWWDRFGGWLEALKFQLPVLQGLDQAFNNSQTLGHLGLVSSTKLDGSMLLEFIRTFAKGMTQAFTKLQLGFALGGISIGEPIPAVVLDCCQNFFKFRDSARDLFDERGFGSRPLLVCCACACHGGVKKV